MTCFLHLFPADTFDGKAPNSNCYIKHRWCRLTFSWSRQQRLHPPGRPEMPPQQPEMAVRRPHNIAMHTVMWNWGGSKVGGLERVEPAGVHHLQRNQVRRRERARNMQAQKNRQLAQGCQNMLAPVPTFFKHQWLSDQDISEFFCLMIPLKTFVSIFFCKATTPWLGGHLHQSSKIPAKKAFWVYRFLGSNYLTRCLEAEGLVFFLGGKDDQNSLVEWFRGGPLSGQGNFIGSRLASKLSSGQLAPGWLFDLGNELLLGCPK